MAEICNKCFKAKHQISDFDGHTLVACVEMPEDQIVFMENYSCGCCKCDERPTLSERMDDAVKGFLETKTSTCMAKMTLFRGIWQSFPLHTRNH
jgi:hypothetical protein